MPFNDDLVPIPTPVQIEAMLLESRRIAQEQARIKQGFRSQPTAVFVKEVVRCRIRPRL